MSDQPLERAEKAIDEAKEARDQVPGVPMDEESDAPETPTEAEA